MKVPSWLSGTQLKCDFFVHNIERPELISGHLHSKNYTWFVHWSVVRRHQKNRLRRDVRVVKNL